MSTSITLDAVFKDFSYLDFKQAVGSSLKALGPPPTTLPLLATSQSLVRDTSSAVSLCIDSRQRFLSASTLASSEALPLPVNSRLGVHLTTPSAAEQGPSIDSPSSSPSAANYPPTPLSTRLACCSVALELSSLVSSSALRLVRFRTFSLGPRLERPRFRVAHEPPESSATHHTCRRQPCRADMWFSLHNCPGL